MLVSLIALVLSLVVALSGSVGFKLGIDHRDAQALKDIDKANLRKIIAEDDAKQVALGFEQVVTYQNKQIQKAQKGWRDALNSPVYRDCKLDAVGLRLLNDRIGEANAAGQLDHSLLADSESASRGGNAGSDAGAVGLGERVRRLFGSSPGAGGGDQ
jgi:hypothetical protein